MSFPRLRTAAALAVLAASAGLVPLTAAAQDCKPVVTVAPTELVEPGKLTFTTNPTLPPMQYVDSSGKLLGMNIDLGEEIARRLCLKMNFVRMDFQAQAPALRGGRSDGIHTGMFWTEERSKAMYLVPYGMTGLDLVAAPNKKVMVASADELSGLAVGVEADSYMERWLRDRQKANEAKGAKPLRIQAFPTTADAMAALRAGQVDLIAPPDYTGKDYVRRGQASMVLASQGGTPTAMAFRSRPLADAISAVLNGMAKDGTYDKLFDKYGVTKLPDRPFAIRGPGPN
ncbi:MAG: ABC transporter substrate-binding protein [Burkholderiaceae bacterium]|nr:ABC transporter substrate-binding protein [Burkholderiaceae bacterium]